MTADVPEPVMEAGLTLNVRPCEAFTEKDTSPEKPLRAETVTLEAPGVPESRMNEVGVTVRAKSTMFTMIVPVRWDNDPEDPVMMTL